MYFNFYCDGSAFLLRKYALLKLYNNIKTRDMV